MDKIQKRFDELHIAAEAIADGMRKEPTQIPSRVQHIGSPARMVAATSFVIDRDAVVQWQTSVKSLLHKVFGEKDPINIEFANTTTSKFSNSHLQFSAMKAVFNSAKEQFEGGFLFDIRNLVHADVFENELEQALYFHREGWKVPALVIAGTVLESALRELCKQNGIVLSKPTINPMNDELAKAGVYNKAMKTQILNWGQNRNSAAHGIQDELDQLTLDDMQRMIEGIRDFVAKQMSQ